MPKTRTRKRPCRICRRWFLPDPRQIGRQKTCGRAECKIENHRRQCRQWNRKNSDYFKANYLNAKLCRTKDPPTVAKADAMPASRIKLGLPTDVIVKVTGLQHLVILEYVVAQIMQRVAVKPALHPP
jgi:hypothetical protein